MIDHKIIYERSFSDASDTNFTQSCAANDLQCECDDHITFGEPPYDGQSAERKWCGKLPQTFRSNGRVLVITYAYSGGQQNAFSLTYSTESEWNGGHSGRKQLSKHLKISICFVGLTAAPSPSAREFARLRWLFAHQRVRPAVSIPVAIFPQLLSARFDHRAFDSVQYNGWH